MNLFENNLINEDLVNELLVQATHLTNRNPEQVSQVDLRRAISATYYALFHFLIIQSVNSFCEKLPLKFKHKICRTFQHGEMTKICQSFITEIRKFDKEIEYKEKELKNIEASNGKYKGKKPNNVNNQQPKKKEQYKYADLLNYPINYNITQIASVFPSMKEERHEADYNLGAKLDVLNVLSKIKEVEEAIVGWKTANSSEDIHNKNIFLMLLLCKEFKNELNEKEN